MTQKIDFIFDFGSPNAYLSHRLIQGIEERTGASFTYVPCLLGGIFKATGNQSPMMAFGNIKGKLAYDMLETQRFINKHDITDFQFNQHFPVNTLLLMRGAIAAESESKLTDYVDSGMRAMWEDNQKMDDKDVFVRVMNDAGFDGEALLAKTQDLDVKTKLITNTEQAVGRGVFGIPTFFVGKEMFFGKDRLDQVEEEIRNAG